MQRKTKYPARSNKLITLISLISLVVPKPTLANPEGGQVHSGTANISQNGSTVDIIQHSDRAVIDWTSFDLKADEHTRFTQPNSSSITLNRIQDIKPSSIQGRITANGQIILVNPNGLVFGKNAVVDVNSLIATSSSINPVLFMNGQMQFDQLGQADAAIVNNGQITAAQAGLVALVSPQVINNGIIQAKLGKIQMASADTFTIDLYGDGLIELKVSDEVAQQLIQHSGTLDAQGGTILLQAAAGKQIVDSLIHIDGELKAPSVSQVGGKIIITGDTINLKDGTHIDVSGKTGGGQVLIGGDYQGQGSLPTANTVHIDSGATIQANATEQGDGGKVIVWADDHTTFGGQIEALGQGIGQRGGFVETSGKHTLTIQDSAQVNTHADYTSAGTWLLDPQDFHIGGSTASISASVLQTALGQNNVTILSSQGGVAGSGNIYVNDALSWSANRLTLTAANDVQVNAVMSVTGTGGLTVNTATTNGADTGVANGRFRMGMNGSGFTGRVDYSGSGSLIINGNTYTIINSLGAQGSTTGTDLQGMQGNLSGHYALGSNIDASSTSTWNSGAGFDPIGFHTTPFAGKFNGLGHTVSNLYVNRSGFVTNGGLFDDITGVIGNVGAINLNVSGDSERTGGLASRLIFGGQGFNLYSTGSVTVPSPRNFTGGLIGIVEFAGGSLLENSFSTVAQDK